MTFKVEFSSRARRDLEEIVEYIRADSPAAAARWRHRIEEKLTSLTTMPEACGFAPENDYASCEVRQMLFGQYRVLFTIREQIVFLLTIRHGARKLIAGDEIDTIE